MMLGMGSESVIVTAVLVAIVLVVGLYYIRSQRTRQTALLGTLASRVGGSVLAGGWFSEPGLAFEIGGRPARLEFHSGHRNAPSFTRVVVDVQGASPGHLHILEEGLGQTFIKLFGGQDLEIGDKSFDAQFVVRATPPSIARRVFRPDLRDEGIRIVRRLREAVEPSVDLTPKSLTVMVREYLRDQHRILGLIDTAREFGAFALHPTGHAGVQLEDVRVAAGAACPVCGTGLGALPVRCESCGTPHHADCWTYVGQCSTYACKGKRCVA